MFATTWKCGLCYIYMQNYSVPAITFHQRDVRGKRSVNNLEYKMYALLYMWQLLFVALMRPSRVVQ